MEIDEFKSLVSRLERESAVAPRRYRAKVAALTGLGFLILALLLGSVGVGLVLVAALVVAVVLSGGTALLLVLKFAKVLWILVIPLWFMVKTGAQALFMRLPAPGGRELARHEAPALFAALDDMRLRMKGPPVHRVLLVDDVNAGVVQRPAFGLVGWPRNHLLLGLPLLEALTPNEALAVVAHEYGHLSGAHGHFSAFVYRLRHTWATVQAHVEHIQGWLARLVLPMVRWYVPYFNAYTFVLARAEEYEADAASARLVGAEAATHALKRVNLVTPRHRRFLEQTFEGVVQAATPPADLLHRWAAQAVEPPAEADARRWLGDALDREGHFADTHPTLRARLEALRFAGELPQEPPPPLASASAAQAWLGPLAEALRGELQARWAEQVAAPWSERHAEAVKRRERLAELVAMAERDAAAQIEWLGLSMQLEPDRDLRDEFAAFNAAHADHALGLYLEGVHRLARGESEGIALLERTIAIDPEATKPASERAHAFFTDRRDDAAAQAWAERWRARDAMEARRNHQLSHVDGSDTLVSHGLDAATLAAMRALLTPAMRRHVAGVWLARRVIEADPGAVQHLLGVRLTWWGRQRSQQAAVVKRLAALEWPVGLMIVSLDGGYKTLHKRFTALPDAALA